MSQTETPLLTTQEVADLVRVSPATVRAWARSNRVKSVKVGGGYRFWRADVMRSLGR